MKEKDKRLESVLSIDQANKVCDVVGKDAFKDATFMWFWWDGMEDDKELIETGLFSEGGNGVVTLTFTESLRLLPKNIETEDDSCTFRLVIDTDRIAYEDVHGCTHIDWIANEDSNMMDCMYHAILYCYNNKELWK